MIKFETRAFLLLCVSARPPQAAPPKTQMLAKYTFLALTATTAVTCLLLLEENESNSDKNLIEDVSYFYKARNEIKTPYDRFKYNFEYYKAKWRMSIRFSWLVKPFLGYA